MNLTPTDGMTIRESASLEPGVYYLPGGLLIEGDNITLDGNGATLIGANREGVGIRIAGGNGIFIRNFRLRDYYHGIHATACRRLTIAENQIASTAEVAPNTIFLDIWRDATTAYGGALLLDRCEESLIESNDVQHQQNGLQTFSCRNLLVRHNQANYNSGFGIHLNETCDSVFENNSADYCSRFEPREGGLHYGHMGADATGFLAVNASRCNIFRNNTARMGGDGFFLAGLAPDGTKCGCDDNLFEGNDGSLSPNIAFEATFSSGNIFRNNFADRCNYGFWLGFSWNTILENNRMLFNRQAGIAVENGHGFEVRGNTFQANGHGILLWTKYVEAFAQAYPDSLTSYDWTIEDNVFLRNGKGIRIAADQDHGIRSLPPEARRDASTRPIRHSIRKNDIQDSRIGIELAQADKTTVEENLLSRNVEANLRQDDCTNTVSRNNMGSGGGYL